MKNTYLLALGCILVMCTTSPDAKNSGQRASTETTSEIEMAQWLIGEWNNTSDEGRSVEIWKKYNDSVYVGRSYFIRGK